MENNNQMVRFGGWSLIVFALLYLTVQLIFYVFYSFPVALSGPDKEAFALLIHGGLGMQLLFTAFGLFPLLLIPASVGAYYAFRSENEPWMRVSVLFAAIAALSLSLCLLRWPSFNWYLARFYGGATPDQQQVVSVVFHGVENFFGIFLGGVLGKACIAIWFLIISLTMLKLEEFPRWIAYFGIIAVIYMVLTLAYPFGIFPLGLESLLHWFDPIEFLWLMIFGIGLLFYKDATD